MFTGCLVASLTLLTHLPDCVHWLPGCFSNTADTSTGLCSLVASLPGCFSNTADTVYRTVFAACLSSSADTSTGLCSLVAWLLLYLGGGGKWGQIVTGCWYEWTPYWTQASTEWHGPWVQLRLPYWTPGYQPKREGDCGYLAQHSQAYSEWVGLVNLGRLPTLERGTPMITLQAGEPCLLWLATQLGEGISYFKLMALSQFARPWQVNLLLFSE